MYLPALRASATSRTDILGFTFVPSDDGKSAIVEYVAADRTAFSQVLSDKSLKIFEKGKDAKEDIETELKKHKKNFSLDNFGVVVR